MEKINLKYRTWYKGVPPEPIKLEIPGWSGEANRHSDGDSAQPWHCKPFVDASTYGLELIYSFETDCRVKNLDGKIVFEGDFSEENINIPDVKLPPFVSFSPDHFGMTSCLDIRVPEDFILRTEPHPAFYTDTTGTFPCCVPGHLQTYWWPKVFFVVFKNPPKGGELIFRSGTPYAQVLVLPKKLDYQIEKMNAQEEKERSMFEFFLENCKSKIVKNSWIDNKGNPFNDRYKQTFKLFNKKGYEGLKDFLRSFLCPSQKHKACPLFKRKKIFKRS